MGSEFKFWVRWEEEMVSNDRGRREVHYYVRDGGGGRDLAVVGREKSARHISYAVPAKFVQSLVRLSDAASSSAVKPAVAALPSDLKLRSRRQVVDWLSLLVSGYLIIFLCGFLFLLVLAGLFLSFVMFVC